MFVLLIMIGILVAGIVMDKKKINGSFLSPPDNCYTVMAGVLVVCIFIAIFIVHDIRCDFVTSSNAMETREKYMICLNAYSRNELSDEEINTLAHKIVEFNKNIDRGKEDAHSFWIGCFITNRWDKVEKVPLRPELKEIIDKEIARDVINELLEQKKNTD